MTEPIDNSTIVPPAQPPTGTPPPETNGGTSQGEGEPSWLAARLQRAQDAARKQLLAEMGIEDPLKAKQLIADAIQRQQDEMTEAQKAQARIAELEPKAQQAERIAAALQATVQKRIEALPEEWRDAVPAFTDPVQTLEWLDKVTPKLQKPTAPNFDVGAAGDKPPAPPTAEAQRAAQVAAQYGYNLDAKALAARQRELEQQRQRKPQGD